MRSGPVPHHRGYLHETAFYGSDEEFLAIVLPFVTGGVEAGEPTVVALAEHNAKLLHGELPRVAGITFMPATDQYARPATAIRGYRSLLAQHVAAGAEQIRVVGDVPHPGVGAPGDSWIRYEAAVNHAYDDFPLWGLCPYDTRTTPEPVLADVTRTHPHIATTDGRHLVNSAYQDPARLLTRRAAAVDALEFGPPTTELLNPSAHAARYAVVAAAGRTRLSLDQVTDLVFAASESVSNGLVHGRGPVLFRLWIDQNRAVVTVTDRGAGPADPLTGLVPSIDSRSAGVGLWVTHQACDYVALDRHAAGFTIRVIVGPPDLITF
ncbi:MAG TPA: sensor histidine kinase [Pseudonocardiaceae bacterium]|nr:sensor histidine kinase [Pseudonocardiaceae bacterium]